MKRRLILSILALILSAHAYADADVQEGAEAYDWQGCLSAKTSECNNDCATSEDINCSENCAQMANDKCQAMGLSDPQAGTD